MPHVRKLNMPGVYTKNQEIKYWTFHLHDVQSQPGEISFYNTLAATLIFN